MTREKALLLRSMIVKASASLADRDALQAVELFPAWSGNGQSYSSEDRVCSEGLLWRCLQDHVSQADWSPARSPSLWARVLIADPAQIPDWVQPDSTNAYRAGDRVRHRGTIWISNLDGNIWEPGVYGWTDTELP